LFRKLKQNRKSDDDDAVHNNTNCAVKAHKVQTVELTLYKYKF